MAVRRMLCWFVCNQIIYRMHGETIKIDCFVLHFVPQLLVYISDARNHKQKSFTYSRAACSKHSIRKIIILRPLICAGLRLPLSVAN